MQIIDAITDFLDYIMLEKGLSKNTIESYKNDIHEFGLFLNKKIKNIEQINKQIILNYYSILDEKQFSKSTLQRRYSALNQFFKYLIRQKILTQNPMLSQRRQKKEFKLPKFLTIEEVEKLLSANNKLQDNKQLRDRLILELLYSTGMRVSELCELQLKSVQFKELKNNIEQENEDYKFITIKGKGQKERIVPLKKNILNLLKTYINSNIKKGQKYLFYSNSKERHINRRTIENIIKKTALKAGIDPLKVSPHTMRHSFATHLLQKGLDIREIQELLGHASINTTSIYAKINTKKMKETMKKYHPFGEKNN